MGPKGAVEIIFRKDIGDPKAIAERTEEYRRNSPIRSSRERGASSTT